MKLYKSSKECIFCLTKENTWGLEYPDRKKDYDEIMLIACESCWSNLYKFLPGVESYAVFTYLENIKKGIEVK